MSNNIYDVLIIGAGLSGLYSAFTILDKEPLLDIIVLEAEDRIGGRILSVPLKVNAKNKCDFDLGAHWISSSQRHMINLIDLLKLTLVPQSHDGLAIGVTHENNFQTYSDHPILGGFYSKYEIKCFFGLLEEMCTNYNFATTHNKSITDIFDTITMEKFIDGNVSTKTAQSVAKNIVQTTCGMEASEVSLMFYLLLCNSTFGFTNQYMVSDEGAREFWIKEGADEMCWRLYNIIGKNNVVLDEHVVEIFQILLTDIIYVKTRSGKTFSCRNVICAIPPNQILNIKFEPGVSRILEQIFKNTQCGHVIKFIITYEKRFWVENGYSGEIFCSVEKPVKICYDATKNNFPALTGFIYESANIYPGIDGTFKKQVINQLVQYFGQDAGNPIDYVEKRWCTDMYSAGSPMTCPGLGDVKWFHTAMTNPLGRVHLAGAEAATEWYGYMNGAVQSGYRAAIEVLYQLRPQTVNFNDIINIVRIRKNTKKRISQRFPINKYSIAFGIAGVYVFYKFYKNFIIKQS